MCPLLSPSFVVGPVACPGFRRFLRTCRRGPCPPCRRPSRPSRASPFPRDLRVRRGGLHLDLGRRWSDGAPRESPACLPLPDPSFRLFSLCLAWRCPVF